jgi:hypothetical protein
VSVSKFADHGSCVPSPLVGEGLGGG